jgi:hypothetical protein
MIATAHDRGAQRNSKGTRGHAKRAGRQNENDTTVQRMVYVYKLQYTEVLHKLSQFLAKFLKVGGVLPDEFARTWY